MFSFRYHIATIVSVFLALAVGLVLGGLIADRAPQQGTEALIESIQQDVALTRETNAKLVTENGDLDTFAKDMATVWLSRRLEGKTIVVLGPSGKSRSAATSAVEAAGGQVLEMLPTLEDAGWQIINPKADPFTFEGIVNVFEPLPDNADSYFAAIKNLAADANAPLISAQIQDETGSLAQASWQRDIAATDTLQTTFGNYSVVALLTGSEPGLYGHLSGASALFPLPPQPLSAP
jgi:hypothetical protein